MQQVRSMHKSTRLSLVQSLFETCLVLFDAVRTRKWKSYDPFSHDILLTQRAGAFRAEPSADALWVKVMAALEREHPVPLDKLATTDGAPLPHHRGWR